MFLHVDCAALPVRAPNGTNGLARASVGGPWHEAERSHENQEGQREDQAAKSRKQGRGKGGTASPSQVCYWGACVGVLSFYQTKQGEGVWAACPAQLCYRQACVQAYTFCAWTCVLLATCACICAMATWQHGNLATWQHGSAGKRWKDCFILSTEANRSWLTKVDLHWHFRPCAPALLLCSSLRHWTAITLRPCGTAIQFYSASTNLHAVGIEPLMPFLIWILWACARACCAWARSSKRL